MQTIQNDYKLAAQIIKQASSIKIPHSLYLNKARSSYNSWSRFFR